MEKVKGFLFFKVATHAYNNIWKDLMHTASSDIHILKSSFVFSLASLLYFLSHYYYYATAYSIPSAEYWITNDYFPCYKCVNFLVDGTYESLTYTEKVLLENEEYVQDVVRDFYQ